MMIDKLPYLCEIAFMYWATGIYKRHIERYFDSWKDFDDMLLFYESIYHEAVKRKDDCSLLNSIQTLTHNEKDMDRLMEKFLSSTK